MTFFTTSYSGLAALESGGFLTVHENTATARVVASSGDCYRDDAVRRILKAKSGPAIELPEDPDDFVNFLEK